MCTKGLEDYLSGKVKIPARILDIDQTSRHRHPYNDLKEYTKKYEEFYKKPIPENIKKAERYDQSDLFRATNVTFDTWDPVSTVITQRNPHRLCPCCKPFRKGKSPRFFDKLNKEYEHHMAFNHGAVRGDLIKTPFLGFSMSRVSEQKASGTYRLNFICPYGDKKAQRACLAEFEVDLTKHNPYMYYFKHAYDHHHNLNGYGKVRAISIPRLYRYRRHVKDEDGNKIENRFYPLRTDTYHEVLREFRIHMGNPDFLPMYQWDDPILKKKVEGFVTHENDAIEHEPMICPNSFNSLDEVLEFAFPSTMVTSYELRRKWQRPPPKVKKPFVPKVKTYKLIESGSKEHDVFIRVRSTKSKRPVKRKKVSENENQKTTLNSNLDKNSKKIEELGGNDLGSESTQYESIDDFDSNKYFTFEDPKYWYRDDQDQTEYYSYEETDASSYETEEEYLYLEKFEPFQKDANTVNESSLSADEWLLESGEKSLIESKREGIEGCEIIDKLLDDIVKEAETSNKELFTIINEIEAPLMPDLHEVSNPLVWHPSIRKWKRMYKRPL